MKLVSFCSCIFTTVVAACSPGQGEKEGNASSGGSSSGSEDDGPGLATGGSTLAGTAGSSSDSPDDVCESVVTGADIDQAFLAFAFDVSGSMGKGDEDWHDRSLKWDPVTSAIKGFFEDPASAGFSASLTFFPEGGGDEDVRCVDANYVIPDVPMTALPSATLGAALDVIGAQEWRGGTPTLHVMKGVVTYIEQQRAIQPGNYAIVLVTDGYPQDCPDSSIASVAAVATAAAASGVPTYVIGVANPPIDGAPDTTSNLGQIAVAGGTSQAFLIDTGDPAQTIADFTSVVEQIRNVSVSCSITIPPPPDGRQFDKQRVRVTYESGDEATELVYDPECPDDTSWSYDDPTNPTQIQLCESTCTRIQSDPAASLHVEFSCDVVIVLL